ncbi:recombinase family protein [Roseomonas stagni]|uniref:Recombinase family protein n=1 Tax=Falsiroseomonas algicola TaxID=2716930 RepID=A0A6M1LQ92_9PROT|nr:recombinase family protein [Falsiroseomonas algicola]NGM21934.1 recombinase family protein [Falsiroseomonas algicola]
MRPRAFSYLRFSTPEQMKGDSFRRQTAAAEQYAARHGLDLDTSLTFQDLGVSAFRGRNAEAGRLADFRQAVEDGLVPPGSYLLVESLDRISRQAARKALGVLGDITEGGVTVVTLNDGRAYDHASLDNDPMSLLLALLTFIRANEESATKAKRLRAAWEGKRLKAADKPLTSRIPAWLELDKATGTFRVIPERAAVVRRIFDMLKAGVGQHAIAETFNREGVPTFGDPGTKRKAEMWHRSYIAKIAGSNTVIGTMTPHETDHSTGKKARKPLQPIEDYYPAVVDPETFQAVQAQRTTGRAPIVRGAGAGAIQSIFAGLARCPLCGSTMTRVQKGPKGGAPRLVCTKAKAGAGCQYVSVRADHAEAALLDNLSFIHGTMPTGEDTLDGAMAEADLKLSVVRDAIGNLVDAIAQGPSHALSARLRDLEAEAARLEQEARDLARQAAEADPVQVGRRMTDLEAAAAAEPRDPARINALLRQSFDGVVVDYRRGQLRFAWKQGGETSVAFMVPTEDFAGE